MTLQELNLIYETITNYRNTDDCADLMDMDNVDKCLWILDREIRLKTTNFQTGERIGVNESKVDTKGNRDISLSRPEVKRE